MYNKLKQIQQQYNLFDISAVERLCDIPQGSLARALRRDQKTFRNEWKLNKINNLLEFI